MSAAPNLPESSLRIEGVRGATALDTALALLRAGFHPTVTYPADAGAEGKNPIGAAWGLDRPTEGQVRNRFRVEPRAGVGICMGPGKAPGGRWLVDFEGDGEEAEASFLKLTDVEDVETMGWESARGRHRLFVVGSDFLDAIVRAGGKEGTGHGGKATYHLDELPGLEIRTGGRKSDGTVKQTHSACPPTLRTDGKPREWTGPEHVAELPDAATAFLEALAERKAIQCEDDPPGTLSMEAAREAFTIRVPASADAVPHYVEQSIADELKILAETRESVGKYGGRDGQTHASACAVFTFVNAGAISRNEAESRLREAARSTGLDDPTIDKCLKSAWNTVGGQTRDLSHVGKVKANSQAAKGRAAEPPPVVDWTTASAADLGVIPLTSVKPRRVNWLWEHRLAEGEMSLVAGEGGLGKSQMLLQIAATISTGGEWPDKVGRAPLGHVYILAAEDAPDTTIVPRLMAMGADLSKIDVISAKHVVRAEGKPPTVHHDCLQDLDVWKARMALRPDTKLLIVDPLASYLGRGVNDSKNAELRAILEPFIDEVTRPRGVCMLCNAHLNKSVESKTPIHRINGSVAYANLARSVSFVTRDKDDPAHRIFSQEKCNIAPDNLPAIRFHVETRTVPTEDGDIETAVPVFDAETITGFSLHEAMTSDKGAGSRGPDPAKKIAIAEWLFDFLQADGNLSLCARIFDAAGEAGHVGSQNAKGKWTGLNALYRAKDYIPQLTGDKAGWEVVTSNEDGSLRSARGHAQWQLRPQGVAF